MKTLYQMDADVQEYLILNGWNDREVSFPQAMVLLHSEVSEALEEWRNDSPVHYTENGIPEGIGPEFADILIRLIDSAHRFGVDLYTEYEIKMAYNRSRPYRHGGKKI